MSWDALSTYAFSCHDQYNSWQIQSLWYWYSAYRKSWRLWLVNRWCRYRNPGASCLALDHWKRSLPHEFSRVCLGFGFRDRMLATLWIGNSSHRRVSQGSCRTVAWQRNIGDPRSPFLRFRFQFVFTPWRRHQFFVNSTQSRSIRGLSPELHRQSIPFGLGSLSEL